MDVTQIDAEQVIARYLAGELSAGESDAFEQYVSEHPELYKKIEATLRFKEGLARLHERGQLDALLRAPAARRPLFYAAAASVSLAILASVLWLQLRSPRPAVLFLSPNDLVARHREPSSIIGTYVLARTRGSAGITDVRLPSGAGAIELRILPSDVSPGGRCSVSLKRIEARGRSTNVDQIYAGSAAADGYVTVYADGRELAPGDYEVSVSSAVPGKTNSDSDRFVIRVHAP